MTSVAQTSDEPVPSRSGRHRSSRRARPVTGAAASGRPPLPGLALVAYVVLAFLFSWSWWVPMAVRGQVAHPGQGWPTHLPGLMGPAFAAVVVTLGWQGTGALRDLGRRAVRWRGVGRWWWSVPGILALGVVGVAVSGATGTPVDLGGLGGLAEYSGAPVFSVLVLLGYVLLVNGYGEELGWRGLLADGLVDRVGEVRTALLVTVVWATWHLPLFWVVESFRSMGWATIGWVLGLCAGSVVLTRLYVGSGRSVLLVAVWHTAFNLTSATAATQGLSAAVTSTAVMVAAVVVLVRARVRDRATRHARPRVDPVLADTTSDPQACAPTT
jgi:membrane protease YdiL (CAAX protease family)